MSRTFNTIEEVEAHNARVRAGRQPGNTIMPPVEKPKLKGVIEPSGSYADGVYHLTAPIKVISEANQREHWAAKNKRKTVQQVALRLYWGRYVQKLPSPPMTVIFTRIGQRKLDDDNLANAFKGLRDQFAKMVGIDDGSDQIRFEYKQTTGRRQYGIEVEVKEKS